jgi:FkbH-like protein
MLDLDNTLWGGVIGDDGLEGIRIAQGDPTGEAYLSVQRAALSLRERGVVLGVSSKNDDVIARRPFREHPEMVLREHHLAVFQANWDDKASNIKAAAADLAGPNQPVPFALRCSDHPSPKDISFPTMTPSRQSPLSACRKRAMAP